jgi:hypothetical protein
LAPVVLPRSSSSFLDGETEPVSAGSVFYA